MIPESSMCSLNASPVIYSQKLGDNLYNTMWLVTTTAHLGSTVAHGHRHIVCYRWQILHLRQVWYWQVCTPPSMGTKGLVPEYHSVFVQTEQLATSVWNLYKNCSVRCQIFPLCHMWLKKYSDGLLGLGCYPLHPLVPICLVSCIRSLTGSQTWCTCLYVRLRMWQVIQDLCHEHFVALLPNLDIIWIVPHTTSSSTVQCVARYLPCVTCGSINI